MPNVSISAVRRMIKKGTSVLRATRLARFASLAQRIDRWSETATRGRLVIVLISLVALVVAIWPLAKVVTDVAIIANERFIGWGYCFERDPSTKGFDGRRYRRSCAPDQISLMTWQDGPKPPVCSDCDNRAAQLVIAGQSGDQLWVEYYLEGDRWLPAHTWKLVYSRLIAVNHLEGFVLQRVDHGIRVCTEAFQPIALEVFVPLDAGRGCAAPSLWGYSAPFARFDRWLDRVWRDRDCLPITNSLYYRWLKEASVNPNVCSDLHNSAMYPPEDRLPKEWTKGSDVSIIRRD